MRNRWWDIRDVRKWANFQWAAAGIKMLQDHANNFNPESYRRTEIYFLKFGLVYSYEYFPPQNLVAFSLVRTSLMSNTDSQTTSLRSLLMRYYRAALLKSRSSDRTFPFAISREILFLFFRINKRFFRRNSQLQHVVILIQGRPS